MLEHITEGSLISDFDVAWARLPENEGGLGLLDAKSVVDCAFVASYFGCLDAIVSRFPAVREELCRKRIDRSYHSISQSIEELCEAVDRIAAIVPECSDKGYY